MANTRTTSKRKNGGFVKLKIVVKRLQKSPILGKKSPTSDVGELKVPEDVKEGHFAVIAVDNDELKRFIVPRSNQPEYMNLSFLSHPSFSRLLEQAAEEYGFDHDGALTVPCQPSKLERILAEQWAVESGSTVAGGGADRWGSFSKTMVKSC